jgi:type I restriction enzyme M protein
VKLKPLSLLLPNASFGYRQITVERPQYDAEGAIVLVERGRNKGCPVPDVELRDTETVPLTEDVQAYFEREVLPHASDAWIDDEKTKVGYEILGCYCRWRRRPNFVGRTPMIERLSATGCATPVPLTSQT